MHLLQVFMSGGINILVSNSVRGQFDDDGPRFLVIVA